MLAAAAAGAAGLLAAAEVLAAAVGSKRVVGTVAAAAAAAVAVALPSPCSGESWPGIHTRSRPTGVQGRHVTCSPGTDGSLFSCFSQVLTAAVRYHSLPLICWPGGRLS